MSNPTRKLAFFGAIVTALAFPALSAADQADEDYDPFRQNRIYSEADLDYRFQFWVSIETASVLSADEKGRIAELIAQEKPAHTTFRVHFVEP